MKYYKPEIECAPRSELEALQSYRLSRTVRRVYENVAPYRKKMDEAGVKPEDIKSIADLQKLPFTVKQDLRDNYPYGMFASPMKDVVRIHASSGTTGKQTVVGYTAHDIDMWAECAARALVSVGGTKDDFIHISYGYGLFTGGLGLHYGAEKLGATAIPASAGNSMRQLQLFKDFGSSIICMTPSYAISLIELMKENNISKDEFKLKAGVFGAEPWTEEMRKEIEAGLGIKAYDIYGLSEIMGPSVSCECECQCGMHICEDHFIPEIIDPDTLEVLPAGQQGELVFTCITKEALPLIRYRTRDIATLVYDKCECGRTLVRMLKPQGRTDDMLIINGVNIFPQQIEKAVMSVPEIGAHYIIEVTKDDLLDRIHVKVEINPHSFSGSLEQMDGIRRKVIDALKTELGVNPRVELVAPNSLPAQEGKAKRVFDLRKKDYL